MIEFEDGTRVDGDDWNKMMAIVQRRAREGKPKPVEIKQGSVTVRVRGLDPKPGESVPDHAKYVEAVYKNWKVRVWRIGESGFGCNYYKDEDVRYWEAEPGYCRDENAVFKLIFAAIDRS